jgi:hypothetical protein
MPAIIRGSAEWNQRGLILSRMDAQEQVNGLVNVQVEYVGPSTRHDIISRSFYQDAPPPIWPSVVSPGELVTNRLYMESRTVERANGLTKVRANYVGGLQRAGFNGYFLRTDKETGRSGVALPQESVRVDFGRVSAIVIGRNLDTETGTLGYDFRGVFIRHTVEFMQIGDAYALKEPKFTFKDMFAPESATRFFTTGVEQDPNVIFSQPAIALGSALVKFGDYLPPKFIDRPQYITPLVKVIEREYFF